MRRPRRFLSYPRSKEPSMLKRLFTSLATLGVAASVAVAQATPKGEVLLPPGTDTFTLAGSAKQKAELRVVDVAGQPFK
ncbi:MAG: hypothetical protein EOP08_16865, partial [Proteobacteria bacterium]